MKASSWVLLMLTIIDKWKENRKEKVLGGSLAPNRIFNAISIRSSRRLRNSLRSDMLADQKKGTVPFFHFFTVAVIRKREKTKKKGTVTFFLSV
jgi:hypothetical protein